MTDNPYESPETVADETESKLADRQDARPATPTWVLLVGIGIGFAVWITARFLLHNWIHSHTGSTYHALRIASWVIGWGLIVLGRKTADQLYQSRL